MAQEVSHQEQDLDNELHTIQRERPRFKNNYEIFS